MIRCPNLRSETAQRNNATKSTSRSVLLRNCSSSLRSRTARSSAGVALRSLALGIGANTAIFTLIDSVILRPLPVRAPQELVVVARNPGKPSTDFNYPDYRYIRDHNQSFSGVLATANWTWALSVP